MKQVTIILDTTPAIFANWLSKHTAQLHHRKLMIENGYINLQRAQPSIAINDPAKSEIFGYIVHELEDPDTLIADDPNFAFIQFDYAPLSKDRTEIICSCLVN